ncbi:hypothetical protein ACXET9_15520 [Brachybacterium sp. DNPG3]
MTAIDIRTALHLTARSRTARAALPRTARTDDPQPERLIVYRPFDDALGSPEDIAALRRLRLRRERLREQEVEQGLAQDVVHDSVRVGETSASAPSAA